MNYRRSKKAAVRKKPERAIFLRMLPVTAAALVATSCYFVLLTDCFTVRDVEFMGSTALPLDSLRVVTADVIGQNILTVSLSRIREQFQRIPEISDVTFRRRFFHRLDCYVKTREPVALIVASGVSEIDNEGFIINRCGDTNGVDLPLITGLERDEFGTAAGRAKVGDALEVLRLLKKFGFSPAEQLSEIHIESDGLMLIWIGAPTVIRMGKGEYCDKVRKLRAVYGLLDERGNFPGVIDLRFDRQVVVRSAGE